MSRTKVTPASSVRRAFCALSSAQRLTGVASVSERLSEDIETWSWQSKIPGISQRPETSIEAAPPAPIPEPSSTTRPSETQTSSGPLKPPDSSRTLTPRRTKSSCHSPAPLIVLLPTLTAGRRGRRAGLPRRARPASGPPRRHAPRAHGGLQPAAGPDRPPRLPERRPRARPGAAGVPHGGPAPRRTRAGGSPGGSLPPACRPSGSAGPLRLELARVRLGDDRGPDARVLEIVDERRDL